MERLLYREGQLLSGADLRDAAERDDALRSLHVKHQHETWGIALGLEVSPAPGGGAVIVRPGHAIDTEGRDLLLSHPRAMPVPSAVGTERFALIATHERPCRGGCGCGGGGGGGHSSEEVGRTPERLTLSWQPPSQVAARAVVLAVARVTGGLIDPPLDLRGRRYARRLWRARLASGSTEGRNLWREWKEAGPDPLGLELDVDTSDASFRETPLYFAALAGPPEGPAPTTAPDASWPFGNGSVLDAPPLGFVAVAHADGFLFRLLGGTAPFGFPLGASEARDEGWHVRWVAVEAGGPP